MCRAFRLSDEYKELGRALPLGVRRTAGMARFRPEPAQKRGTSHTASNRMLPHCSGLDDRNPSCSVPVGFVPKLLFDQWSHVLSVKDFFDPCGRALFSEERGIVYEAYPHSPASRTSGGPTKVPSQGDGSGVDHH